jgi:RNA polymerase sigma-70 factor (ECF subfamily)
MPAQDADTEKLIERASQGSAAARQLLLTRHQHRLRRMVAVHLDRRLAARMDPSDVVQEALAEAAQELSDYLRQRPTAFYPWIRRIAWEHLVKLQRRHLRGKRSVMREEQGRLAVPDESADELAKHLEASGTSPTKYLVREELRSRVREALARLSEGDREVLLMRYLEQLSLSEIATILAVSEAAVKMRRTRALGRLCALLGVNLHENQP